MDVHLLPSGSHAYVWDASGMWRTRAADRLLAQWMVLLILDCCIHADAVRVRKDHRLLGALLGGVARASCMILPECIDAWQAAWVHITFPPTQSSCWSRRAHCVHFACTCTTGPLNAGCLLDFMHLMQNSRTRMLSMVCHCSWGSVQQLLRLLRVRQCMRDAHVECRLPAGPN